MTHLVWKFRGEMTLKGVGKNPYLAGAATHTDAQLRSLQKQAGANKIIYYSFTNGSDIKVMDNGQGDQRRELDFCYHAGYLGHVFGAGAADGRTGY